jgi:hypothetical protein
MAHAAFSLTLKPEFGPFLFATIGKDPNGTLLTVLSAFARTTIDPWQEAAQLAKMPRQAATVRLAAFISKLPNQPNAETPAATVASELIALLPRAVEFSPKLPEKASGLLKSTNSRVVLAFLTIALVNLLILMAMNGSKPVPNADQPAASDRNSTPLSAPEPRP